MNHNALTNEQIRLALSYCDAEDQEVWIRCGMAIKSELGDSGRDMWLEWSALASNYKQKEALTRWKSFAISGGIRIGSLVHEAMRYGFKLEKEAAKVSKHVQQERMQRRLKMEEEAKIEADKEKQMQAKRAIDAVNIWRKAKPCESHPYLEKKDVLAHGLRMDHDNNLVIPMINAGRITSLQFIDENGNKKMFWGGQKSGSYYQIGDITDSILLCEGWATGATLHEATQLCVFVAFDAGNLPKVAHAVRKLYPLHKIIICADNDQYKKVNAGIKAAEKAACYVDADIVIPVFKDVSSKPTDFNDLYKLEGYSPIIDLILPIARRSYTPKVHNVPYFDAFKLKYIEDAKDLLETSNDPLTVARAALVVGQRMADDVPAFVQVEQIRKHLDHPLIHHNTHKSIMCRVLWSIQNRKRRAMTAIKPMSWRKHNHVVVSDLADADLSAPINVVFAPMGSGKTQKVIKPFSQKVDRFVAVAHRRSLISDLSETLGIESYSQYSSDKDSVVVDKLAICLPSIEARAFKQFISSVNNVAVDEISQNIRFTNSKECKAGKGTQEDVFYGLKTLINESEKVVVCDASIDQTTIDFLELARPDEKLNIIEQVPSNLDRECYIYTERADFLTKISIELENGGKVWLAVESADRAEVFAEMFGKYNVITITSKNSKNKKIKHFLENIDDESRNYDLVIASPAISSGVSVEHRDGHHFTMIAGMASGHSICFSDFAQMLGRVRYVKNMHVCLQKNNHRYEQISTSSVLTGLRQAAALEGISLKENEFTRFKTHIDIVEQEYRADFANGFIWFMQYYCFSVKHGVVANADYALSEQMKLISSDLKEKYRHKIKVAKKIGKEEARVLDDKIALSDEEEKQLIAFRLRMSFNFSLDHDINDTDLDMFENIPKVDRFARMMGYTHNHDDSEMNIALRKFENAQVKACRDIFEGIDLSHIKNEDCDIIFNRISSNNNRFLYSALKLIPSAYGKWQEDNRGNLRPYPEPKIKTKPVAAILDKFGLSWKRRNGRSHYYYTVDEGGYSRMKAYADSRYNVQ